MNNKEMFNFINTEEWRKAKEIIINNLWAFNIDIKEEDIKEAIDNIEGFIVNKNEVAQDKVKKNYTFLCEDWIWDGEDENREQWIEVKETTLEDIQNKRNVPDMAIGFIEGIVDEEDIDNVHFTKIE